MNSVEFKFTKKCLVDYSGQIVAETHNVVDIILHIPFYIFNNLGMDYIMDLYAQEAIMNFATEVIGNSIYGFISNISSVLASSYVALSFSGFPIEKDNIKTKEEKEEIIIQVRKLNRRFTF